MYASNTVNSIAVVDEKIIISEADIPEIVAKINTIKVTNPGNIMAASFDEGYFNTLSTAQKIKLLTCCYSGIANPDSGMGVYALSPGDYDEFFPFFKVALEKYHKVDLSKVKHVNNWSLKGVEGLPADGQLDLHKLGLPDLSMRVRTGRNLKKYNLPGGMSKEERINLEADMGKVFGELIKDPAFGG